ncbi:formate dehydrogenase subunit gamma [Piscinibacter sp. XHJ-5]|uniref:formate dehydrogenase subunit gamma n=1 Tax=Piscinibacter sp. XHJ-5 TaxID=3037797 RepID=UPI002452E730|nr:formate dehydrogenase subunit gamma [Piscinibacter sp. XHJ-5]
MHHGLIRIVLLGLALAFGGAASAQQEPTAPRFAAPASTVAAPEPKPDDTNALRAKSQPGNNAPFWRQVHESGTKAGITSLPGAEKGVLVQPFVQYPGSRYTNAGEAWRQVRNDWIIPYGSALLVIVLVAIALFHWRKGPIGHAENRGGTIERFTYFERAAHWTNAVAFCVLGISGIVMAFGKFFLLPITGHLLFGWISYLLKTAHNFFGPLFAVSLVIVIVTFVRDELPRRGDLTWIKKGGGMLGGEEVPSHRFNAGEKLLFWGGAVLLGLIVVGSGLVLDKLLPGLDYLRSDMQVAHMVHAVAAVFMIVLLLGHIYLGTAGMRGAYRAMRDGYVDDEWAREHHALWHQDIEAGKIPAQRSRQAPPAEPVIQP